MATKAELEKRVAELEAELAVARDLNAQKQGEEQLRESKALLQALLDNSPSITIIKDLEGRIILNNRQLEEVFKVEQGELLGKTEHYFLPKEVADEHAAFEREIIAAGKPIEIDEVVPHDDGPHDYLTIKFPIYDEKGTAFALAIIATDITERKQTETERERLQQEVIEAQKRAILELSTPVIPIMDRIIVMPLVGSIDSLRARDITRSLLAGINQHRAKVVILDVTGVGLMDTGIVNHLNKTIQAARLKGAKTIVTGISDAVAEAIVDLGIDWGEVETLSDLRTGLVTALGSLGLTLNTQ
jgi:rsbT co-antagonist protein RsbR